MGTTRYYTLDDVRAAAQRLADAHNDATGAAAIAQAEVKAAIAPVLDKYRQTIDTYAAAEAAARAEIELIVAVSPHLFVKPRSLTVDGVRAGYVKDKDAVEWDDEQMIIERIRVLLPEQEAILVRRVETLIHDAVAALDEVQRTRIGVRTVTGVDRPFVTVGDNDTEKLSKILLADATRRQGEEETAKAKRPKKAAP